MSGTVSSVAEVFCILKKETLVIMTQNKNLYDIYIKAIYDVYYSF